GVGTQDPAEGSVGLSLCFSDPAPFRLLPEDPLEVPWQPRDGTASGDASAERDDDKNADPEPPHSITSSARASTEGGIVRPSALAVLRLISKRSFVGCSTGRSAGLAPLMILAT